MKILFIKQYVAYGLLSGLLISGFAWLKSEFYFSGSAPDLFLTIVALFFATGGWFLHYHLRKSGAQRAVKVSSPDITLILSKRELEVYHLLLGNDANKQIADHLSIELSTLKTHINAIYKKTGVQSRRDLRLKFTPTD